MLAIFPWPQPTTGPWLLCEGETELISEKNMVDGNAYVNLPLTCFGELEQFSCQWKTWTTWTTPCHGRISAVPCMKTCVNEYCDLAVTFYTHTKSALKAKFLMKVRIFPIIYQAICDFAGSEVTTVMLWRAAPSDSEDTRLVYRYICRDGQAAIQR